MTLHDATQLLLSSTTGSREALDRLIPLVHRELRRMAGNLMRGERAGHTLQPTALVNEVYIRMVEQKRLTWQNRAHFLAIGSRLMRELLVEQCRKHRALKRGRGDRLLSIDSELEGALQVPARAEMSPELVLAIDGALEKLENLDERQARIVEMKLFAGLKTREISKALGGPPYNMNAAHATVEREWRVARMFLRRELGSEAPSV